MPQHERIPGDSLWWSKWNPEGSNTQHLKSLVPKTRPGMGFGTRSLKYWVLGPSGAVAKDQRLNAPGPEQANSAAWM